MKKAILFLSIWVLGYSAARAQCHPVYQIMGTPDVSVVAGGVYGSKIAADRGGNVYVTNYDDHTISKISRAGAVSIFVSSGLNHPAAITIDTRGNLYVVNKGNYTISKITPGGMVSTYVASISQEPWGITIDDADNLFVSYADGTIRKINPSGTMSTFYSSPNHIGSFFNDIVVDHQGNIYGSALSRGMVNMIDTNGFLYDLYWLLSGTTVRGFAVDNESNLYMGLYEDRDEPTHIYKITPSGHTSAFYFGNENLSELATDNQGNFYLLDATMRSCVRISQSVTSTNSYNFRGKTLTLSGTYSDTIPGVAANGCDSIVILNLVIETDITACGSYEFGDRSISVSGKYTHVFLGGAANGLDSMATINLTIKNNSYTYPGTRKESLFASGITAEKLATDGSGNVYVLESSLNSIRKITPAGVSSIFVSAGLNQPGGIVVDSRDNIFVFNEGNKTISKITPTGVVSIFISSGLDNVHGLIIDGADNLYFWSPRDSRSVQILKITPVGMFSEKLIYTPFDIEDLDLVVDRVGNIFYLNRNSYGVGDKIVKINPSGELTLIFPPGFGEEFEGLALDRNNSIYVSSRKQDIFSSAESYHIIKISPEGLYSSFPVTMITPGSIRGRLTAIHVDQKNNHLYAIDTSTSSILKITQEIVSNDQYHFGNRVLTQNGTYTNTIPGGSANGCDSIVTIHLQIRQTGRDTVTITACGSYTWPQTSKTYTISGYYSDTLMGGSATGADSIVTLNLEIKPNAYHTLGTSHTSVFIAGLYGNAITADREGNLYVGQSDGLVTKITPGGLVSTIASLSKNIHGIAVDAAGNVYTAHRTDSSISKITPQGTVSVFASGIRRAISVAIDYNGNLLVTQDIANGSIFRISPEGNKTIVASNLDYLPRVAVDRNNNIYFSNWGTGSIMRLSPTGEYSQIATGLSFPSDLSMDSNGNLYVNVSGERVVKKIAPNGHISDVGSFLAKNPTDFLVSNMTINHKGDVYVVTSNTANNDQFIYEMKQSITACGSYRFDGEVITQSGTYMRTIPGGSVNGCDSIVTLYLDIKQIKNDTISQIACGSYNFGGRTLNVSGTYKDTIAGGAANGCDSIVILNLEIKPIARDTITHVNCGNYIWPQTGIVYTVSGFYSDTISGGALNGCDSIVTLNLEINPIAHDTISRVACESYFWPQTGIAYTVSGFYSDTIAGGASSGCDSIITLLVDIKQVMYNSFSHVACGSYNFAGTMLNISGIYIDTIPGGASNGCDSIITLDLVVKPIAYDTVLHTAKVSYTWPQTAQAYWESGFYTDTVRGGAVNGCDSIVTLNLTILPIVQDTILQTACNTYTWQRNNKTYAVSGYDADTIFGNGIDQPDTVTTLALTINRQSLHTLGAPITTVVASGFDDPSGITRDDAGNLYITNFESNYIHKITPAGEVSVVVSSGLSYPAAIARDRNGNLFVANRLAQYISKVSPSGEVSTFVSGISTPYGITVDKNDNLYVTNYNNNSVSKITPAGGVSTFASGVTSPYGITIDMDGNLYVTNYSNNSVSKITPAGVVSLFATGLNTPRGITIDGSGNLYVTNYSGNAVNKVTPDGVVSVYTSSGMRTPHGIAADETGSLYVTNSHSSANNVSKITPTVTSCRSYIFGENTLFASGTYRDTIPGGASNGCDSIVTLNLVIPPLAYAVISDAGCLSYTWLQTGNTYNISGHYADTIRGGAATGCDSIVILNLVINQTVYDTINQVACDAYTWSQTGNQYTASGYYADTLTGGATIGCDSIVVLSLVINQTVYDTINQVACDAYTWSQTGNLYTSSGYYADTLTGGAATGCDSIVVLSLVINQTVYDTISQVACNAYTWPQTGNLYTASGYYADTLTGGATTGCDSIVVLSLVIIQTVYDTINQVACNAYTWPQTGNLYTSSGYYADTLTGGAATGCDSIVVLSLVINQTVYDTINQVACNAYTWSQTGNQYTASGYYSDTIRGGAATGCDSIVVLSLVVNAKPVTSAITGSINVLPNSTHMYSVTNTSGSLYRWYVDNGTQTAGGQSSSIEVTWGNNPVMGLVRVVETSFKGCDGDTVQLQNINVMPVKLISFTASPLNDHVNLQWTTANEENASHFLIEKSHTGTTKWKTVGKVSAKGNNHTITHYEFTDSLALPEAEATLYYRLKQVDHDGRFEHSKVAIVHNTKIKNLSAVVFPNPSTGMFMIKLENNAAFDIIVTDVLGKEVLVLNNQFEQAEINLSDHAVGPYFIQLKTAGGIVNSKIVIAK